MKYCGFELNGQSQYGLVETVAGAEQITRLLEAMRRRREERGAPREVVAVYGPNGDVLLEVEI